MNKKTQYNDASLMFPVSEIKELNCNFFNNSSSFGRFVGLLERHFLGACFRAGILNFLSLRTRATIAPKKKSSLDVVCFSLRDVFPVRCAGNVQWPYQRSVSALLF